MFDIDKIACLTEIYMIKIFSLADRLTEIYDQYFFHSLIGQIRDQLETFTYYTCAKS
jgi:hypothetical protein